MTDPFLIGQRDAIRCALRPDKSNRHGLITGATGTGKTITLQTIAEAFSGAGVPVFMADVKGDLTGISQAGSLGEKLGKVLKERGLETPEFRAFPVTAFGDAIGDGTIADHPGDENFLAGKKAHVAIPELEMAEIITARLHPPNLGATIRGGKRS